MGPICGTDADRTTLPGLPHQKHPWWSPQELQSTQLVHGKAPGPQFTFPSPPPAQAQQGATCVARTTPPSLRRAYCTQGTPSIPQVSRELPEAQVNKFSCLYLLFFCSGVRVAILWWGQELMCYGQPFENRLLVCFLEAILESPSVEKHTLPSPES